MFNNRMFTFLLLAVFLSSCGKKASDSSSDGGGRAPQSPPNQDTRLDVVIKDQKLECEDPWKCPDNVAKIVITGQKFINNCTGILIAPDEVLTSASCLPKSLRIKNINCMESAFFVFPQTALLDQEIRLCDKVIYADSNIFSDFPELWKNDMAILKLKKPVTRTSASINRRGVDPGNYQLWKVDVLTDKKGLLKRDDCNLLQKTYLNPFSDNPFSGMFVSSGCELDGANAGAALLNSKNQVMGIFAKEMSDTIYSYLQTIDVLSEEMERYFHFSNSSCMLYEPNSDREIRLSKMCQKLNTFSMLDKFRARMLRNKIIHQEEMERIEEELEKPSRYFLWDVKFHTSANGRTFEAHFARPKCIYNVQDWINEFSRVRRRRTYYDTKATIVVETPKYIFHTKLDKSLQPVSRVTKEEVKQYKISFNPYTAYVKDVTNVVIESELDGRVLNPVEYEDITDKCPR